MTSPVSHPTPYPYVNEAVQLLLVNVRAVLNDNFVGLYLHGSLASGDFDPGHSDIDFLVVTARRIPSKQIPDLEAIHMRVRDSGLEWAKQLEGTYFSKRMLLRYQPSQRKIPYLNEGKFFLTEQGIDWIINRHILREKGIVVAGPPLGPMIAPVSSDEIRRAIVSGLLEYWPSKLDKRDWLEPPKHQPYIVVTCCRALYTLKHGTVESKPVSTRWALKALDKRWKPLIESAAAWHYGMPPGDIEETLKLMRYTLDEVEKYRR
ncbi:MAG: aminoglycoside adenylyltransferase domain-containing protein [Dehalococcoidales bacterium]